MGRKFLIAGMFATCGLIISFSACDQGSGDGNQKDVETSSSAAPAKDDGKGVGEVKNVELTATLDESMISQGKEIFNMKCAACHQLTDQRVVGPGLEGITNRRKPEWIMNMINNPELMIKEDPTAKKLLAEYMTPMANQNVSIDESRAILEFFRFNDEQRTGSKDEAADAVN